LVTVLAALVTSIALSHYGEAGRQGIDACSSSTSSPLLGYGLVALVCGCILAVPTLWLTMRVLRVSVGFRSIAPRAVGVILVVVGAPLAAGSFVLSDFSYSCLF
jgi:hypothetical protein